MTPKIINFTHAYPRFYFDVETTGLNHEWHEITQISAMILDYPADKPRTVNLFMRPSFPGRVESEALTVQRKTLEELSAYPLSQFEGVIELLRFLGWKPGDTRRVDKNVPRYVPIAYNGIPFDFPFLTTLLSRHGVFSPSWINNRIIDPLPVVRFLEMVGVLPAYSDHTQKAVAQRFGITVDEEKLHDAAYDVELLHKIVQTLETSMAVSWGDSEFICSHIDLEQTPLGGADAN